jgi:DNA-directed RNA polymerase specialized sigma subunit
MTTTCILWWLLLPLVALLGVVLWLSESREQRVKRLRRQGWTQQRIADHLLISRSTVRRILTA